MSDPLSPAALPTSDALDELAGEWGWPSAAPEHTDLAEGNLFQRTRKAQHDATLAAERQRLLGMTPEAVVEAAVESGAAKFAEIRGCECFPKIGTPHVHGSLSRPCLVHRVEVDYVLRAALPLLLAPEVAKREAAERERDEARALLVATQRSLAMVAEGSLSIERSGNDLRAALERIANAIPEYWAGKVARAALQGGSE